MNTKETSVRSVLEAFGFVTNEARRNLVVFFLVLLIFSNTFFIYRNIVLTEQIQKLNNEKHNITLILSNKITEEVRRQITPTTTRINETIGKIDSVAIKVDSVASKTDNFLKSK